jgi:hypothetical protein
MTLRLSRHQRLELCRLRSGHLLLLCWTLAPVRWPTKRVSAGWVKRIVRDWPRERAAAEDRRAAVLAYVERALTTQQHQEKGTEP